MIFFTLGKYEKIITDYTFVARINRCVFGVHGIFQTHNTPLGWTLTEEGRCHLQTSDSILEISSWKYSNQMQVTSSILSNLLQLESLYTFDRYAEQPIEVRDCLFQELDEERGIKARISRHNLAYVCGVMELFLLSEGAG